MTRRLRTTRSLLLATALALGVAGCESFDFLSDIELFGSQKKKLDGERKPVFPTGVPGIEYGSPPPQPTNANIAIDPNAPPPAAAQETEPTDTPARSRTAQRRKSGDPWDGAR